MYVHKHKVRIIEFILYDIYIYVCTDAEKMHTMYNAFCFYSKKIKLAKQRKAMMHNPQAATNLKTKVRKLPLEKSQLLHAKMSEGLPPVNNIGNNITNSSEIISSLLQGGSLDQSITTSSLSNLQTSLLTSASNSEMSNSTLMGGVTPSDNLLKSILSGSLSAKTEKLGVKSSSPTGKVNNKPASESAALPKVKPVLPDDLPESLLSKITLLEMVCIVVCMNNEVPLTLCKLCTKMFDTFLCRWLH